MRVGSFNSQEISVVTLEYGSKAEFYDLQSGKLNLEKLQESINKRQIQMDKHYKKNTWNRHL